MATKEFKWKEPGTEGTNEYVSVARSATGRVSVREYAPGQFRVRVKPLGDASKLAARLTRSAGWKQPGDSGQNRFSTTCGASERDATVKKALLAITADGESFETNSRAPAWAKKLLSRPVLVAEVKACKVAGSNLASAWSTGALCKKAAAFAV